MANEKVTVTSASTVISAADVMSNVTLAKSVANQGDTMTVTAGGAAYETTVNSAGTVHVKSSGNVSGLTLHSGQAYVSNGGSVSGVLVDAKGANGGIFTVYAGGYAENVTMTGGGNWNGSVRTYAGAVVSSLTFKGNSLKLFGGTVYDLNFTGNYTDIYSAAVVSGGTIAGSHFTVGTGGAIVRDVTVTCSDFNVKAVAADTRLENVTLKGGTIAMSAGQAAGLSISGGTLRVMNEGVVQNAKMTGGALHVSQGGLVSGLSVNSADTLYVSSGGVVQDATITGGTLNIFKGGLVSGLSVSSATKAGEVWVSEGGILSSATVQADAILHIFKGGYAENIVVENGITYKYMLQIDVGGVASNVEFRAKNAKTLINGTVYNYRHVSGASYTDFNKGAYISGGVLNGAQFDQRGGTVTDFRVEDGKYQVNGNQERATFADGTMVGGSMIINNGDVQDLTISGGSAFVSSNGSLKDTEMTGGKLTVFSGAVVSNVIVGGSATVSYAPGAVFSGTLTIKNGGRGFDASLVVANDAKIVYDLRDGVALQSGTAMIAGETQNVKTEGGDLFSNYTFMIDDTVAAGTQFLQTNGLNGGLKFEDNDGNVYTEKFSSSTACDFRSNPIKLGKNTYWAYKPNQYHNYVCVENPYTLWGVVQGLWASTKFIAPLTGNQSGTADTVTVGSGLAYVSMSVSSGAVVAGAIASSGGVVVLGNGGTVTAMTVNSSGLAKIVGSGIASATVNAGGSMTIVSGGVFSGKLQINNGAKVSAAAGAGIEFNTTTQADPTVAQINDWSLISGGNNANYTITVSADPEPGSFVLANGAAGFDKTKDITIRTAAAKTLGTLKVNGSQTWDGTIYALNLTDGTLKLSITSPAVKLYSGTTMVSGGMSMTKVVLTAGGNDLLVVSKGGTVTSTTVNQGTLLDVLSGGTASGTTVNQSGAASVANGGTAFNTKVNAGGAVSLYGRANTATISGADAMMAVGENGVASGLTVNGSGAVLVGNAGSASGVTVSSTGMLTVEEGATLTGVTVASNGKMTVDGGAVVSGLGASKGAILDLTVTGKSYVAGRTSGKEFEIKAGQGSGYVVMASGALTVRDGGAVDAVTVSKGGAMAVQSGGSASGVTVSSAALLTVEEGGTLIGGFVNYGGDLTIGSGAYASGFEADHGAILNLTLASGTYIAGTSNGSAFAMTGQQLNGYTVWNSGSLAVLTGGVVSGTTVVRGAMTVGEGGVASTTIVSSRGTMTATANGVVNGVTVSSAGLLTVESGAVVSGVSVVYAGALVVGEGGIVRGANVSRGSATIQAGATISGLVVSTGAALRLAVASDTYIEGTSAGSAFKIDDARVSNYNVTSYGSVLDVLNGGVIEKVTFGNGGSGTVMSGGTASGAKIIQSGYFTVFDGGVATNTIVSGGAMDVQSGGVVDKTFVSAGTLTLSSGSLATSAIVTVMGSATVLEGACVSQAFAYASGTLCIASGGVAEKIRENGGYVQLEEGASAAFQKTTFGNLGLSAASASVHSGTTALEVTLLYSGRMDVFESGVASNTIVSRGGELIVSKGGLAVGGTVAYRGAMSIVSGGTMQGVWQLEDQATVSVASGAILDFNVAEQADPATAFINNWSLVTLDANACCIITVLANQKPGAYALAGGVETFASTVTVRNTAGTELGTLTLSNPLVKGNTTYTLTKAEDGLLTLGVAREEGKVELYSSTILVSAADVMTAQVLGTDGNDVMTVTSGGIAKLTTVNDGGSMTVEEGGAVCGATVNYGGVLNVAKGGSLSGNLQFADGASVSVAAGTVIDFTVAEQTDPKTALINDWSLISGGSNAGYTITVKAAQMDGTYTLAGGASGFTNAVTVKTTAGSILGTLAVNETKTFEGVDYTLAKNDSVLSLTVSGGATPIAKSDVDGNGISDVMFQYTGGDYQIGFWMNGTSEWQATGVAKPSNWVLLGNYDMDTNGKADQVVFGNVLGGAYIGYYKDGNTTDDGWVTIGKLDNPDGIVWSNVIGNLTGNAGKNSIVWHAAELGAAGVWTDGTTDWVSLGSGFDSNWELQGCGDFTGDGKDEVLWKYSSALYTTDINGNFASLGSAAGLTVRAIGDFSGDGIDDLVLFSEENGVVLKYENGLAENWSLLGQLDASDWFIVGAGDYNNDQKDDLLVRQYSTGMLGYYSAGNMSQWVEMGRGVDMQWTVVA